MSAAFTHKAILFHDELRTGTRTELGRKWGPVGHRPVSPVHIGYESVYLYLALCPFTGQGYAAFLPKLNAEWFGWFLQQIQTDLDRQVLFVADGATAHKADLFEGSKLTFSRLPVACPDRAAGAVESGRAGLQGNPSPIEAPLIFEFDRSSGSGKSNLGKLV